MKPIPAGFHDPRDMDTSSLERAVVAARLDRFEGTDSMQQDLRAWLEVAELELSGRVNSQGSRLMLETKDGEVFSTSLERKGLSLELTVSGNGLEARIPLTSLIVTLLVRKLGRRVLA